MLEVKVQELEEKNAKSGAKGQEHAEVVSALQEQLRAREKELRRMTGREEELREEAEELGRRVVAGQRNEKRLLEKVEGLERELTSKREMLLAAQESSKQEIVGVLEQAQSSTASTRRQLEQYYLQLHQQQDKGRDSQ